MLSFEEISQSLGMPRSSAYKYLALLKEKGFLDYDRDNKKYRLGIKFIELGSLALSQIKLDKIALPYLQQLANEVKETVILSYLSSGVAFCLERVGPDQGLVFSMQKGAHLPLYSGASAKVLLASLSESEIDATLERTKLVALTKNTITDPKILKEDLLNIKKQGYAFSDQEVDLGARAVAAPILNKSIGVTAGLCVVGPQQRMDGERLARIRDLVIKYAQLISNELSHQLSS